jgi:hypothetical protein
MRLSPEANSQLVRQRCRSFVESVRALDTTSRLPIRVAQLQSSVLILSLFIAAYIFGCLELYQRRVEASYWLIAAAFGGILVIVALRSLFQSFVFYDDHILAKRIFLTTKHRYADIRSVNWVRISLTGLNSYIGGVEICFSNGHRLQLDLSTVSSHALSVVFRQAEVAGLDTSKWLFLPDEANQA